jgi:hypothetical protein
VPAVGAAAVEEGAGGRGGWEEEEVGRRKKVKNWGNERKNSSLEMSIIAKIREERLRIVWVSYGQSLGCLCDLDQLLTRF